MNEHTEAQATRPSQFPGWIGYAAVIVIEVAITAGLLVLQPYLPLGRFPIPYVLAIGIIAYLFSEGPAILAFAIGVLAFQYFFVPPGGRLWPIADTPIGWAAWIAFVLGTLLVGLGMSRIRSFQHRMREALRRAEYELTERKQAEEALRETEHDLNRAQAIAHIGSWRLDVQHNVLFWSDETYRIFGIPKGTPMTYEIFLACIHPDDLEYVNRKWMAALNGETYDIEHRIVVGNTVKWVRETAELEFDQQGRLLSGFGTVQDITDRKRAEQALEQALNEAQQDRERLEILIVENARLYEQLAQSRDEVQQDFSLLQRSLLPLQEGLQIGPGFRIAVAYLSPFGLEVGGDFYDAFDTESGKHAILIGDVAGKGISAVSLATATRSTIRALVYDIPSVGEALTHANSVLCSQTFAESQSAFITVFVTIIDPATDELRYASAGHPPPAIYHSANGTVDFLDVGGIPLRVTSRVEFEERSYSLLPGDKIVLYTDGLSEARRGSEMFGFEGIQRILQEHGRLAPEDLVNLLIEAASTWAGGKITDDTAIVVVERKAPTLRSSSLEGKIHAHN